MEEWKSGRGSPTEAVATTACLSSLPMNNHFNKTQQIQSFLSSPFFTSLFLFSSFFLLSLLSYILIISNLNPTNLPSPFFNILLFIHTSPNKLQNSFNSNKYHYNLQTIITNSIFYSLPPLLLTHIWFLNFYNSTCFHPC